MKSVSYVLSEEALIAQCVMGSNEAWAVFVSRYRGCVRQAACTLLGARAADLQLVDDIEAWVWFALCANDYRQLRAYDAGRGALAAYLAFLTQWQVYDWRRECWQQQQLLQRRQQLLQRQQRLLKAAPAEELVDPRVDPGLVESRLEELEATLMPQERRWLDYLCGRRDPKQPCPFSDANCRKLTQRILQKWQALYGRS
jgi:hypothetical protein